MTARRDPHGSRGYRPVAARGACGGGAETASGGGTPEGGGIVSLGDEWQLPRRYMQLEALRFLSDNQPARLSAVVR